MLLNHSGAVYAGTSSASNPLSTLNNIKILAYLGNAEAQYKYSKYYASGKLLPINKDLELYWLQLAAQQGNADALYSIATKLRTGDGMKTNFSESFQYLNNAAIRGNVTAQHDLGVVYLYGYGTTKNIMYAYIWSSISELNGNSSSKYYRLKAEQKLSHILLMRANDAIITCIYTNYKVCI